MQFPYPFPRDMGRADHYVKRFSVCPALRAAVLVRIQSRAADLGFSSTAFRHKENQFASFQLLAQRLRGAKLGVEQRIAGVIRNVLIDFTQLIRNRLFPGVIHRREAFLDPVGDFAAELLQVLREGTDIRKDVLRIGIGSRNGNPSAFQPVLQYGGNFILLAGHVHMPALEFPSDAADPKRGQQPPVFEF